jgi:hypothetical protein
MNINELFNCKEITASTLNLYQTKLKILNDYKPIKNLNFLNDIDNIKSKIEKYKPNTRRTYIISIVSILKCLTASDKKPTKKLKKLFDDYSIIMNDYNSKLKDQTTITDGTKILKTDEINDIYEEIKQKVREYKEKTNYNSNIPKEKKQEYNKRAYLKKKEKIEDNKNEIKENGNI